MLQGKTLILGHGRHGKDTVAEILRDKYGVSFMSSSYAALDVIYPILERGYGYDNKEEAYEDRVYLRKMWKELISLYNAADKSALAKLILSKCDMYVGMRCHEEFAASKHLFDRIIWVEGGSRIFEHDPTLSIKYTDDMYLIDNNGTLDKLHKNVEEFINDQTKNPRVVQPSPKQGDRITCRRNIRSKSLPDS